MAFLHHNCTLNCAVLQRQARLCECACGAVMPSRDSVLQSVAYDTSLSLVTA
jgi:hypothetical protein